MENSLWFRSDLRNMMDGLAQTVEVLPPSVDLYRIGYLRALRDMATLLGIYRPTPLPRRPLPQIIVEVHQP